MAVSHRHLLFIGAAFFAAVFFLSAAPTPALASPPYNIDFGVNNVGYGANTVAQGDVPSFYWNCDQSDHVLLNSSVIPGGWENVWLAYTRGWSLTGSGGPIPLYQSTYFTLSCFKGGNGGTAIPLTVNVVCPTGWHGSPPNCTAPVYGCTDPNASNWNPSATDNDGTCSYPNINSFYASPATQPYQQQGAVLYWTSTANSQCYLYNGYGSPGYVGTSGSWSVPVLPSSAESYYLECYPSYPGQGYHGGWYTYPTPANVYVVPTCTLGAVSPTTVTQGTSVSMSYTTAGPITAASINGVSVPVVSSGSYAPTPSSNTTYTMTVSNANGSNTCGGGAANRVTVIGTPQTSITTDISPVRIGAASANLSATFTPDTANGDSGTGSSIYGDASNPDATFRGDLTSTVYSSSRFFTFSPTIAGTYTFYARLKTASYPSWTNYSSVTVPAVDPGVSVTASDPNAGRGVLVDTGTFTFTRVAQINSLLTVNFTLSGTAVSGVDYQPIGSTVTFLPGENSTTTTITPKNYDVSTSKTATLTLAPGSYVVGSPSSASVIIQSAYVYLQAVPTSTVKGGSAVVNYQFGNVTPNSCTLDGPGLGVGADISGNGNNWTPHNITTTANRKTATPGGTAPYSLLLDGTASSYFSRTPLVAGDTKAWTLSLWVKPTLGFLVPSYLFGAGTAPGSRSTTYLQGTGSTGTYQSIASGAGRSVVSGAYDASNWTHLVVAASTTEPLAANRLKLYVNGGPVSSFAEASYPSQNTATLIDSIVGHYIAREPGGNSFYSGYLADINFVDGKQLTPDTFAQSYNGAWVPKNYVGPYGVNGFHMDFSSVGIPLPHGIGGKGSLPTGALSETADYTLICSVPEGGVVATTTRITVVGAGDCTTGIGTAAASCPSLCEVKTSVAYATDAVPASVSWCCPAGPSIGTGFNTGGALTGSVSVGPGTYTVSCATGQGTVTVQAQRPPVISRFTMVPPRVNRGGTARAYWNVNGLTSDTACSISPALNGETAWDGVGTSWASNAPTNAINQRTVFTLTCTNAAGAISSSATVDVLPLFKEI